MKFSFGLEASLQQFCSFAFVLLLVTTAVLFSLAACSLGEEPHYHLTIASPLLNTTHQKGGVLLTSTTTQQQQQRHDDKKRRLAVLIPFRDRDAHLKIAAPYLHMFLRHAAGHNNFRIFLMEQTSAHRFNRASLLNVGFTLLENEFDYFAFQDVDWLPTSFANAYEYPSDGPRQLHTCEPEFQNSDSDSVSVDYYRTRPPRDFGASTLFTREDFKRVNGMSNRYWGWGWEDFDLFNRAQREGLKIEFLPGMGHGCIGRYDTLEADHHRDKNEDNEALAFDYKVRWGYKEDGLSDLEGKYKVVNIREEALFTRIVVEFKGPQESGSVPNQQHNVEL